MGARIRTAVIWTEKRGHGIVIESYRGGTGFTSAVGDGGGGGDVDGQRVS